MSAERFVFIFILIHFHILITVDLLQVQISFLNPEPQMRLECGCCDCRQVPPFTFGKKSLLVQALQWAEVEGGPKSPLLCDLWYFANRFTFLKVFTVID